MPTDGDASTTPPEQQPPPPGGGPISGAIVDAGLDAGVEAGPPDLRVFVSSTTSKGNLGGNAGGDLKCQNLANNAGLGGNWIAWLSNDGSSPRAAIDRLTSNGPWRLVGPGGELVANTKADLLTGGFLRHGIDRNEFGTVLPPTRVWTGSGPNGRYLSNDCDEWRTGDDGRVGITNGIDGAWTSIGVDDCDNVRPIYCFEL